jgi:hypothetical protein
MTYRIRRGDADLGTATLDELRRRRESGELTGAEQVKGDGDSGWQPLEEFLNAGGLSAVPPVPASALPRQGTRRARFPLIVGGAVIAVAVAAFFAFRMVVSRLSPPPEGLAIASRPLPVTKTPTVRDVKARTREFDLRQWLEGYQKRGVHDPSPDPATEEFIRVYIDRIDNGPGAASPLPLDTESRRLAQDPNCKDPLVITLAAVNTLNWYDRVNLYKRAAALFPSTRHLAYPAFYADVNLMNESKYDYDKEGELNTSALALLSGCFADGSFQPRDQQEIASLFIDSWGFTFFSKNGSAVCDVVNQAGPSYRWLALVLDGERLMVDAWNVRGGGRIDTVSAEQLAEFKRLLGEGGKRLTEAWGLHPDYPLAASLMIYDSLGGTGLDAMRTWFDRAIAAQIDYPAAWKNMRWGLRPRWYGSRPAELALGRAALNTGRFDTDVPRKLFDFVEDVESWSDLPPGQRIFGQSDIWPDLQRMYEGYVAEPTQEGHRRGWRTSYAAVAYFAGHYDVARRQLEAIDWKLAPAAMTSWGVDLSPMPLEVAARTGPLGAGVAAAEAARVAGDRASALRMFSELDAKRTTDARTREFIQIRLSRLTDEQHLAEGKWISLMPANDQDTNWVYSFGDARRNADGSLDVEYGPKGHMLFQKMQVGGNFEVRGRFEVIRSTNTNFQAGIVIGWPDIETYNWYGFRVKRHDEEGDVVCFGLGWSLREIVQHVALNDKSNSFDLVLNDGRVTASVNDEKVFDNADTPSPINVEPESYFVGLGAFSDSADAVVRYQGVELRKLSPTDAGKLSGPAIAQTTPEPTSTAAKMLTNSEQIASDRDEMNRAIERVKQIVNQPALSVPIKEGMNVTWWSDTWFHPGATVPDYGKVDITKSQEFPYSKCEYVASKLHPDTAFLAADLEFNSMTKYFYTDRSVPKKRLTRSEMAEINRLYRVIARCEADLEHFRVR